MRRGKKQRVSTSDPPTPQLEAVTGCPVSFRHVPWTCLLQQPEHKAVRLYPVQFSAVSLSISMSLKSSPSPPFLSSIVLLLLYISVVLYIPSLSVCVHLITVVTRPKRTSPLGDGHPFGSAVIYNVI